MAAPSEAAVDITPSTLIFLGNASKAHIKLSNPSESQPIAFKVKTTAPKRYCVRPTGGVIHPGTFADVQVILNAKERPAGDEKSKDKFQVQTLAITKEQATLGEELKSVWQSAPESSVFKRRIKCYFKDAPLDQPVAATPSSSSDPVFTPTIPSFADGNSPEPSSEVFRSSHSTPIKSSQPRNALGSSNSHNRPRDFADTSDDEGSRDPVRLQEELHEIRSKLKTAAVEKDQLRRENDRLKEEGLRQRKLIDSSSTHPHHTSQVKKRSDQEGLLSSKLVQFIIVALLFFLLGKML
eukprot:TRINITY_DN2982_c0_g1_i1.p1 TRINITY_DN2982_c0_g1~~TRINITY_DN2982_c0_g1_i1.p1  ORF type:complete len:305 (-),score=43.39 TRINITY_DN2982_c0_g1_i1:25-909(-)